MQDLIGYDEIIEKAMRSVIFESLKKIEKTGLPGKHYFVITFMTKFPKVSISKTLIEKYPEEMTIALQFQYRNLLVEEDHFRVSLSFGGKFEKISIPYRAITSFSDPSMNFAMKFSVSQSDFDNVDNIDFTGSNRANSNFDKKNSASTVDLSAKVISLDAFRKNKDSNSTN